MFFTRVNCTSSCRASRKSLPLFVPWVLCAAEPCCWSLLQQQSCQRACALCLCSAQHSEGSPGAQQSHLQWCWWSPSSAVTKIRLFIVRLLHRPINCPWECSWRASCWLLPSRTGHLLGDNVAELKHSTNLAQCRWLG